MERIRQRLYEGMAERGVVGDIADQMWDKLSAFANYGFPESHSVSFAYLVYASSWLKRFYPAAFCAGLLNAQPMGFYSPHSLVQDARRHGVEIRTPDLNESGREGDARDRSPGWTLSRARRTVHRRRCGARPARSCGSASVRCAASATSWPTRSRPDGPTSRWKIWRGGCRRSRCRNSRRWPLRARSVASTWRAARRCGRSARWRRRDPTDWPAS